MFLERIFSILLLLLNFPRSKSRIVPLDSNLTVVSDISSSSSKEQSLLRLDGSHTWHLSSTDGRYADIPVQINSDILTNLEEAGIIDDPFFNNNFLDQRHVWMGENRTKASGTKCYDENIKSDQNGNIHSNYRIPNLEERTRVWKYETNFTFNNPEELDSKNQYAVIERTLEQSIRKRNLNKHQDTKYHYVLIIEGIKMGASVYINDEFIGNVTDQFLRYIFPIKTLRKKRSSLEQNDSNTIQVIFDPRSNDSNGRFSAMSGGWDWAPYSKEAEYSCSSRRVLSFGIPNPIYILKVQRVLIKDVVSKISYEGDPTSFNASSKNGMHFFLVQIDVHLQIMEDEADIDLKKLLKCIVINLDAPFGLKKKEKLQTNSEGINISEDKIVVSFKWNVDANTIHLWWPVGMGQQHLYNVSIFVENICTGATSKSVTRKIGFRSVALVTHKNNDYSNNRETGDHGMIFLINGATVHVRGANVVPPTQLEGRLTKSKHIQFVRSAVEANMNMLRIWGGGMILPQSFYDSCDEEGILLFHDLMFVEEQFHGFRGTKTLEEEIKYMMRQLSFHPSIILYNGCNECDRTVSSHYLNAMSIVAEENGKSRIIWWSSPSAGFTSGIDTYGLANGLPLKVKKNGSDLRQIEIHGPYNHGYSKEFPTINGHWDPKQSEYDTHIPSKFEKLAIGPDYPNSFVSEFGSSVFSSLESMTRSLSVDNWGIHSHSNETMKCSVIYENANDCIGSNVIAQRNYSCDSHIVAYFGHIDLEEVNQHAFGLQLYQCMLSHMLWIKSLLTEMTISQNTFGVLIWMLNDQWPTGSWGLLDSFGNRKPLFYELKRSLFRDIFATCGLNKDIDTPLCYVRNWGRDSFTGLVRLTTWNFTKSGSISFEYEFNLGSDSVEYFELTQEHFPSNDGCLLIEVENTEGRIVMEENLIIWVPPKDLIELRSEVRLHISDYSVDGTDIIVTVSSESVALYVYLESTFEGTFENNLFSMLHSKSTKLIRFRPKAELDQTFMLKDFIKSIRIYHLGSR